MKKTKLFVFTTIFMLVLFGAESDIAPGLDNLFPIQTEGKLPVHQNTLLDTVLGSVIFEMDAQTPCIDDNQLLGVEFDGTYFYITGGNQGVDPNKVYVLDTTGDLKWVLNQPAHASSWGWRDLAWDGVYADSGRIDTLYASFNAEVDKFGINLATGTLDYYGSHPGPLAISRALAWDDDSAWFFTANFDTFCNKFSKTDSNIQNVSNNWKIYGAAYDTDNSEGGWIWWHSQDYGIAPFHCQIEQMNANSMAWTSVNFGYSPTIIDSGFAGGLCFYEGFRGMDVLFALIQGYPFDAIVGIFVRWHISAIEEHTDIDEPIQFDIVSITPNPAKNHITISYTMKMSGYASLKVYDITGKIICTLVNGIESAGTKTIYWDGKDDAHYNVPNGVYFLKLNADNEIYTKKLIVVR